MTSIGLCHTSNVITFDQVQKLGAKFLSIFLTLQLHGYMNLKEMLIIRNLPDGNVEMRITKS